MSSSKWAEEEPKSRRQACAVLAEPRARSPRSSATITPALPSSSGWARSTSGQQPLEPVLPRSSERRNGEPTAIGWVAEQSSWSRPGTVSSLVRVPPPIVVLGLEHGDLDALAGERHGAGEPVGARADDDGVAQATGAGCSRPTAGPAGRPRPGSRTTRRARAGGRPCRRRATDPSSTSPVDRVVDLVALLAAARSPSARTRARSPARRPAPNPQRSWTASSSCLPWKWASPKFQPLTTLEISSPSRAS